MFKPGGRLPELCEFFPGNWPCAGLAEAKSAAVATFFVEDAVIVTDTGPIYGRKAVEKSFVDLFL
jgi:hypothetical protein